MKVLLLGTDRGRLGMFGATVHSSFPNAILLDGSKMIQQDTPSKNWISRAYDLVVVDYQFTENKTGKGPNIAGIEAGCAKREIPLLIITNKEDLEAHIEFDTAPNRSEKNPPWRCVCRPKDIPEAFQALKIWLSIRKR